MERRVECLAVTLGPWVLQKKKKKKDDGKRDEITSFSVYFFILYHHSLFLLSFLLNFLNIGSVAAAMPFYPS